MSGVGSVEMHTSCFNEAPMQYRICSIRERIIKDCGTSNLLHLEFVSEFSGSRW